jgi:L-lyxonate dehydratase
MHQNVALVKTTREAVGDNVDIMADAYMGWNLEHARRMLRMPAPYNMRWVEEPVISDDLHAYAELKALNIVNISGGEHEYTIHGFRGALDLKAFDIAQFDVNRVGGITAAKKIADMCEANDVLVIPHARPDAQLPHHHVELCRADLGILPQGSGRSRQRALLVHFDGEPVVKDGFIDLSDTAPGFGLTLKPVDANFKLTR